MTLLFIVLRDRKISQRALAREIGCSKNALWSWLSGKSFPMPALGKALEQKFGLPIEKLLGEVHVNAKV